MVLRLLNFSAHVSPQSAGAILPTMMVYPPFLGSGQITEPLMILILMHSLLQIYNHLQSYSGPFGSHLNV